MLPYWKSLICFGVSFLSVLLLGCGLQHTDHFLRPEVPAEPEQIKETGSAPVEKTPGTVTLREQAVAGEERRLTESEKSSLGESQKEYIQEEESRLSESPDPNQGLLDSALEYYQASNDFWEHGDLDNAIDALDKAFSLILRVDENAGAEIIQQKEDLRITIAKRIVEVYASRFAAVNGYHKAIPLIMNKHVESAIDLFKGRDRNFFIHAYRRSGQYRPFIVEALREAGLPEELSWLPFIESGYKVRALSSARALGLWQFIATTGYKFGLKRDFWIDERMDPEKSTLAAIAYLKELHNIFGDWSTALAAYNCGEYRVLRNIKNQKINYLDNFWDLYEKLPRETAFYVPKFLAVLHILNDPEAHGFELPPVDQPVEIERVSISKQVHLQKIATHLGTDYDLLRELNPELRQYLTPNGPYEVKVPMGKGETLLAKLKDIPVWIPPVPAYVVHRVRPGETLSVIAGRYKTSIPAIMTMNGLKSRNYIKVGWNLKIPTGRKYIPSEPVTVASGPSKQGVKYVVRQGDTLWKIANKFQTTTKALMAHNQLANSKLQIGQVLLVSPGSPVTTTPGQNIKYRVKKGDSPYLIAKQHRMNLADFLKLNHLTPHSTIFPGQIVSVMKN